MDNDIIVMGSDGVFDNLYDRDVAECVQKNMEGANLKGIQETADCLSKKSVEFGHRTDYVSPFCKGARESGRNYPPQGKLDDVSVVVAQIGSKSQKDYKAQKASTNGLPLNVQKHEDL